MVPIRILLVDDTPEELRVFLETLKQRFVQQGIYVEIDIKLNTPEALDHLRETDPYDIVLLDIVGVGYEDFLREVKDSYPDLPVVMFSRQAIPEEMVKCIDLGARNFIFKLDLTVGARPIAPYDKWMDEEKWRRVIDKIQQLVHEYEEKRMKDFFVSYNKADKDWAEWIAWTLEEAGYSVVIQAWDFRPGGNFVLEMQKAAIGTQKTIAVLSENYLSAEYTHPEWAIAFARDPQGHQRTLIPIRVRKCTPSGLLGPTIYVDLIGLSEQDAGIAILGAFSRRAKPLQAPAFPATSGGATQPAPQRVVPEHVQYPNTSVSVNVTDSIIAMESVNTILTAPVQPHLASQPLARLSPAERLTLNKKLNALATQQFNMLIFALNPPPELIPPMPAPQGDRTFALLSWTEGPEGCGLHQVQQILNAIMRQQLP